MRGSCTVKCEKKDALCALPLILCGRDFVWLKLPPTKVRDGINYNPGDATSKIDKLVKEETGKAGGDDGVTDHEVPVHPLLLDPVERGKSRC